MNHQLFNHLWQSTVFAVAIALAASALRRNSPRVRYWLWLAASLKFLIPFSLLVSTGATVKFPPDTPSMRAVTVQQISTYFAPATLIPTPASPAHASRLPIVAAAIWLAGALFLLFRWYRRWRALHELARKATPQPPMDELRVLSSPEQLEPGVLGILQPVLLLPEGITDTLTQEQLEAVLAHERCHIRYRDNLTAALHMCVETIFWFHPLVWFIGARLMEERERDCDQAVLLEGNHPGAYARGIIQVCGNYVESPIACAAGISGSDLKTRIREIMTWSGSLPLSWRARTMLAVAALAAVSLPFAIGILRAQSLPPAPAYTYDAVSIHKSAPGSNNHLIGPGPQGGLRGENVPVMTLITVAYSVQDYQIIGAPGWAGSETFDFSFTPDKKESLPNPAAGLKDFQAFMNRNAQRLQSVLRDRFGLVLRAETRELPIYSLVQAKGGHKLSPHDPKLKGPSLQTNGRQTTGAMVPLPMIAQNLSMLLHRPVRDDTHIDGEFDFKLTWNPDLDSAPQQISDGGSPPAGASLFTAITEQLGLRLESTKGPVQVYVVEKVEHPTEN